jgi:hypothetical protein
LKGRSERCISLYSAYDSRLLIKITGVQLQLRRCTTILVSLVCSAECRRTRVLIHIQLGVTGYLTLLYCTVTSVMNVSRRRRNSYLSVCGAGVLALSNLTSQLARMIESEVASRPVGCRPYGYALRLRLHDALHEPSVAPSPTTSGVPRLDRTADAVRAEASARRGARTRHASNGARKRTKPKPATATD